MLVYRMGLKGDDGAWFPGQSFDRFDWEVLQEGRDQAPACAPDAVCCSPPPTLPGKTLKAARFDRCAFKYLQLALMACRVFADRMPGLSLCA